MEGSSEHISFVDQLSSVLILNVKNRQNMIIDIEFSHYDKVLRPIIECLKFSPLSQALIMAESITLVHLSKAYSLAIYTKAYEIIHFEVSFHKTSITKACFCILLGFTSSESLVDPESISNIALIGIFYQMGFIEQKSKNDDQKGNEASASNKGKEKLIDDEEEEEGLSKSEKLMRKKRDKELDDLLNLRKKLEAQEAEEKIEQIMLETQKSLFPPWSICRIQKEANCNAWFLVCI
ncbi:unnamed protein product [Lactuca saligna]|uniref:Uncharacterized protein n=1 Tax=Lactuca saligna TaxID=75948 RepID=A0AA36DYU6_LACSI|nr:unnamed protein product [Lactuca saligna]